MRTRGLRGGWMLPLLAIAGIGAANPNAASLAEAVKHRDGAAVLAQLKQRVDVNAPLPDGTTAVHWAVHWNDVETANLLIRAGGNVNAANRYGATPLWMACLGGKSGLVTTLLKAGANPNHLALDGESPLMAAARAGSVEAVAALLAHGANVNVQDAWRGQTALMLAVGGHEPHADVARILVENHADVNARSTGGFTPLLFAARQGDLDSVRVLVEAGADVNDKGKLGNNVILHTAINNSAFDVAEYLVEKGASPNTPDRQGFTPLHNTVRKRASDGVDEALDLMKSLVARGADVNARLPTMKMKWPANHQVTPRPPVDEIEYGGATPFWIAANAGDVDGLRLLVSLGADRTITSIEHTTPLMVAAGLGYGTRGPTAALGGRVFGERHQDSSAFAVEVVEYLIELGEDINAVNDNGQTALHASASAAFPEVTKYLIEHGARLDLKDTIGRTPLSVAEDNRTDKFRANQNLVPALIESTWALLR